MFTYSHRLRRFRARVPIALLLATLSAGTCSLAAQTAPVAPSSTLEVLPESLELQSCDFKTPLFVLVRNTGSAPIASITLDPTSDPKIILTPDPPGQVVRSGKPVPARPLQKGDQRRWSYRVTCTSAFSPGSLIFTATARSSTGPSGLSQITLKAIPIKLRPPDALETIATVDIKSNLETLTQASLGDLLVAVTNKSTQPIAVKVQPQHSSSITFSLPDSLKSTADSAKTDVPEQSHTIDGGETFTFPYIVKASRRVAPGKQLLGVNVAITNDKLHSFLVTKEVTVGVLGESEVLKLLGIPSLLFLPGFLVMTSFGLLWRAKILRPSDEAAIFDLDEKDPGYWVISIILSAVILACFVLVRPSFLSLYGLQDIALAWVVSIVIGAVFYVGWRLYTNGQARKNYPQPDDTVERVLERLVAGNKKLGLPSVTLTKSGDRAFLLATEPDDSVYVCPQMILTWTPGVDPPLRNSIEGQLTTVGDPAEVLEILQTHRPYSNYGFSLEWAAGGLALAGPRKVAHDCYQLQAANSIVIAGVDSAGP